MENGPWSSFILMGEFVECGDSSLHGSESGDKSPHSKFGGLNDDQGRKTLEFTVKSSLAVH